MRRHVRLVSALLVATMVQVVAAAVPSEAVEPRVPTQFIAKVGTEALGRLPEQNVWQSAVRGFESSGCSAASVGKYVRRVFLSPEYAKLGYDNPARAVTLYRAILNRDPDPAGYTAVLDQLQSGARWSAVVDSMLAWPEFVEQTVPRICGPEPSYGFGSTAPMAIPTSGTGFAGGTGLELQLLLDTTPVGGTVWLAQKALVRVDAPVIVPAGVTLATVGTPGPTRYALQGRLYRASLFAGEVIRIQPGGTVKSVWVDGQRSVIPRPEVMGGTGIDVNMVGGTLTDSTLIGSSGWTSVQLGTIDHSVCTAVVARNLVTAYASGHDGDFTDGISSYCDNTLIEHNQVVDTTDVAIIIFPPNSEGPQRSEVRYNTVLSAGNSGYGAYAADGLFTKVPAPDFTGSTVHHNLFWTGGRTHFDVGLVVGTRAWFGGRSQSGIGASFTDNTTGTVPARVAAGAAVSGMLDVTVLRNTLTVEFAAEASPCPQAVVGASVSAGFASGDIQPYTDVLYDSCITTGY
ncbi:DUF4214 domain-containing protein [Kribbella sp. NBC_01245]|uniref:DUF4214 domain-containing protein n=1 Tax=Kribbella sp. NBC_01245 TaxID=2903578 RepID=UPI002E2E5EBC|nr:DUF4214 domain-containing protein [Kribbella sp. NBC_01245]